MDQHTFDRFRIRTLAAGFEEPLERRWPPGKVLELHTHPFDADAVVAAGEMWLTCKGQTRHLLPGDTFVLPQGTPHAERYGPHGATYWVARRPKKS